MPKFSGKTLVTRKSMRCLNEVREQQRLASVFFKPHYSMANNTFMHLLSLKSTSMELVSTFVLRRSTRCCTNAMVFRLTSSYLPVPYSSQDFWSTANLLLPRLVRNNCSSKRT